MNTTLCARVRVNRLLDREQPMISPPFASKIASAGPVASNALQDASPRRRVVSAASRLLH